MKEGERGLLSCSSGCCEAASERKGERPRNGVEAAGGHRECGNITSMKKDREKIHVQNDEKDSIDKGSFGRSKKAEI